MADNPQWTNLPDYQKIRQTSQTTAKNDISQGWTQSLETLTPSPSVFASGKSSENHKSAPQRNASFPRFSTDAKEFLEAQSYHNSAAGFGNSASDTLPSSYNRDDAPYRPEGYSRPVTKYVDAQGIEHRVIRRGLSPGAKQRRSYPTTKSLDLSVYQRGSLSNVETSSGVTVFHQDPALDQTQEGGQLGENAWKDVVGSAILNKAPQKDLRHWQQQHQEELLHQHLETQALYESPHAMFPGGQMTDMAMGKLMAQDQPPARWEPVKRAADNIIREKNMIIDKLKNRILELEDDFKSSETKLRQTLITSQDDSNLVHQKLQEMQHRNVTLSERMNEVTSQKNSDIHDLEVKLGALEFEAQRSKKLMDKKEMEISSLKIQVEEKSQEAVTWHQQFDDCRRTHHDMKKKLDSLQGYLNDLPTLEESRLTASQVLSLREDNVNLKTKIQSMEQKLSHTRKLITTKDFQIRELKDAEKESQSHINSLTEELEDLRNSDGQDLHKAQKETQALREDKDKLRLDLDKARKLLETTLRKLDEVQAKYQTELSEMENRLVQDSETVQCLRDEIASKDSQIEKLKESNRDLGSRSQELLCQGLVAKEEARQRGSEQSEASAAHVGKMVGKIGVCVSEMSALVNLCISHVQGLEPDMTTLLGIRDEPKPSPNDQHSHLLEQWDLQIDDLRKQMDEVRGQICNKYAEDMGNNVHCTTQ